MSQLAEVLHSMAGKDLFICCKPDVADFTDNKAVIIAVMSAENGIEVTLPHDAVKLRGLCGKLTHYFFGGHSPNLIIGWNLKNLFSYILAITGKPFHYNSKLFDLRILENYIGKNNEIPKDFEEAKLRLMSVVKHPSWNKLKNIWENVYIPLSVSIVPELETIGIIRNKQRFYSYYEIASQVNGRMKCSNAFRNSYNPHTMSEEDRAVFRPPDSDGIFCYLDIKHMEVSVLQWLTGDPKLKEILESGQDLYDGIWKTLTTIDSNEEYRKKCKGLFLPVVYGLGVNGLAEKNGITGSTAKKLIDNIRKEFSVALGWIEEQQDKCGNEVVDYFGRVRKVDEPYKARNFVVQSPAAILCFDKLIRLHEMISPIGKLGMHIHDGYVIFATRANRRQIMEVAKQSLESESKLFPGLKLKVSCKFGEKLLFKETA